MRFEDPLWSMDLERLVVIATRASASASELVINGLRPFIPVTVVGDDTFGKPVGQYGFDFCDQTLFPVAFELRNAAGDGNYYGGIRAECAAVDDLDHPLGSPGRGFPGGGPPRRPQRILQRSRRGRGARGPVAAPWPQGTPPERLAAASQRSLKLRRFAARATRPSTISR